MTARLDRLVVATALVAAMAIVAAPAGRATGDTPGDRFAANAGLALRQRSEAVESMERSRELRLRAVQADTLLAGRRFERLDQYYRGVRVFGGEVVRETDGRLTLSIAGTLYGPILLDTTPTLEPGEAVAIFEREAGVPLGPRVAPELVILPTEDGAFALAYRVTAFVNHSLPVMFVNARSGAIELRYDNLQTQQPAAGIGVGVHGDEKKVSGTQQGSLFQAWDQMRPTKVVTNDLRGVFARMSALEDGRSAMTAGDMATSTTSRWNDAAVVDAHSYLGWTYDYFYRRHGWKGFDNHDGRAIYAMVHAVRREDMTKYDWSEVGNYYANAFFCGQCGAGREDILMFGEGLPPGYYLSSRGQYVTYYAASLDIVAHEYTHGITGYSSGLIYRNESGALNEAFSDMMGTGVEFFFQEPGSGLLKSDYLHGEDTYLPGRPGSGYGSRSLADPAAFGHPDHYSKRYVGTSDNGGVHTNSSIANHAFYLAIEGGTNRTSGLAVHGVGAASREQIEKVFFRAFTALPADANFSQARARTIQSAKDLYGTGGVVERAVTEAWTAVGVQ